MAHAAYREEHPLPALVLHWLHLISIAVLTFTGFYIHGPFFAGGMGLMRNMHFVFMFVLIAVAVLRVIYAFVGRSSAAGSRSRVGDYRHFGIQQENRGQFFQTIKYYLFLRKTHPRQAKYNPLQKMTYWLWLLLIIAQAVTGLAIWAPTQEFFLPLTYLVGGLIYMRAIHYLIMWLFIITTMIHIYLSLAEAIWEFPLMFWWKESGDRHAAARE